jgi:hypothetical protein
MPFLDITCPHCGRVGSLRKLAVPGTRVRCPECRNRFEIPSPSQEALDSEPPPILDQIDLSEGPVPDILANLITTDRQSGARPLVDTESYLKRQFPSFISLFNSLRADVNSLLANVRIPVVPASHHINVANELSDFLAPIGQMMNLKSTALLIIGALLIFIAFGMEISAKDREERTTRIEENHWNLTTSLKDLSGNHPGDYTYTPLPKESIDRSLEYLIGGLGGLSIIVGIAVMSPIGKRGR